MGIFLQGIKNIEVDLFYKFLNFLKVSCINVSSTLQLNALLRQTAKGLFAALKFTTFYFLSGALLTSFNFCDLKTQLKENLTLNCATKNIFPAIIHGEYWVLKIKILEMFALVKVSYSNCSLKYTHTWKTIFYNIYEKSNLLVRSDNNTEFSWLKFLQTTTI